jgi:glycosyltransferase involved in cell wall biosynthesis
MKFCMITTFFGEQSFGGDSVYVERLSQALLRRGHEVDVVHCPAAFQILHDKQPPRDYRSPAGLRIHSLGQGSRAKLDVFWSHQTGRTGSWREFLRRFLDSSRFDVIHLHNISLLGAPQLIPMLRRWQPAILLVTIHDYWWICPQSLLWKNQKVACQRPDCWSCQLRGGRPVQWWRREDWFNQTLAGADALIFPSRNAQKICLERNLRHPRMEIIPSFVPDNWFAPETTPATSSGSHLPSPSFASAGRLVPEKGFQELIEAAQGLPDFDFHIAGCGPQESRLRRQARENPRIRFTGLLPPNELCRLFQQAGVVVVPSLFPETFCFVAAEALALGVPVVARRRGALEELIRESEGGLLFETVEELRQALRLLMLDSRLRQQLGRHGREAAARLWSEELHMKRYMSLIRQMKEG